MEPYVILNLGSDADWDDLLNRLLEGLTPAILSNLDPARRLFDLLRNGGCRSVVIEAPFMDEDHRHCHARLHVLSQAPVSRYCTRLHFFSTELDVKDLRDRDSRIEKAYLAMCVWRPSSTFPVGRTILSIKLSKGRKEDSAHYPTCCAKYRSYLAGRRLELTGVPFFQQDHMVAACATASIWMAQWHMSHRHPEFARYYSPQITELVPSIGNPRWFC